MNKQILILLFFVPTILSAQQTQKVVDKATNEIFYVLKSDKKTKHGQYNKFSYQNKLLVNGYYKHGAKDSIWECFDFDGKLNLKYDFTKNAIVFYEPTDREKNRTYRIVNGNGSDTILSKPPIYLGGDDFITNETVRNTRYPPIAQERRISGKLHVLFTVDKFGKTSNYYVDNPLGYGLDEEVIRVMKLIPDNWLPGQLNGQPIDVEIVYPFQFILN